MSFRLNGPFAAAALLCGAANLPAAAQVQEAAVSEGANEIIVTGTRQLSRTVAESLAPIDVLSASDLAESGRQSVRDLLGTLIPSMSVSNSGAGASFAVKTLSLRGLAGDHTLVLVNGKRRHNTATMFINGSTQNGQSPPDLDLIPVAAIERIEVLRDGASAQYGSDAIAGVVNIILKSDAEGGSAAALLGTTWDGGGETGQALGNFGLPIGPGGYLQLAGDVRMQNRTIRGGPNLAPLIYTFPRQPRDPREDTVSRYVNKPGQPQVIVLSGSYNVGLPIGETATLYSFGTIASRHSDAWLTFRNPNASNNIVEIYPDGYSPRLHVFDDDYQVAAGVRGTDLGGSSWALSTTYSRNDVEFHETTALNASLGPASPMSFYIGKNVLEEWTTNLDLGRDFETGLFAEPLFVAIGGEYRKNWYEIGEGEPASYIDGGYVSPAGQPFAGVARVPGSQGVTGFPSAAAGRWSRRSYGVYLNVEQTLVEGFDIGLAGRFEDYSDAGQTTTGKASARIEPAEGVAVRGTVSTGFRAPTLQQQHYASSSTIGVLLPGATTTVLYPVQAVPPTSAAAIALGAAPLEPEESTNFSAGLVLQPMDRLNITIDAYQIKVRDRIILSGNLVGTAVSAALASAGLIPEQAAFYFSNAADTRTRGLDIVATYNADFDDLGRGTFSLSGNFNETKFTSIDLPPPELAAAGLVLIDRARQGDLTRGTPRDKFIGNINWEVGRFNANIRATRYGKVVQVSNVPANDDPIEPKVIFDLDVSCDVNDLVRLSIGANNLFNTYPTVLKLANQGNTGFSYYNPYSPYGISGGYYYARFGLTF